MRKSSKSTVLTKLVTMGSKIYVVIEMAAIRGNTRCKLGNLLEKNTLIGHQEHQEHQEQTHTYTHTLSLGKVTSVTCTLEELGIKPPTF